MSQRRVALGVVLLGTTLLLGLAALLVPWQPLPGGDPAPVGAFEVLDPAQVAAAEAYSRWARVWSYSSVAVSLTVAAWWALSRRAARVVSRVPGPWWVQVPLVVALLAVTGRALTLPLAVAWRELRLDVGLTTQSWPAYGLDVVKALALDSVLASLALLVLLACARRWARAWPAVVATLAAVLVVGGSFAYPVLVEPVFNRFAPLPDGPLRQGVLALADEQGVGLEEVLVADASRRTTALNAYVSGFGGSRRVVLYDTLVDDLPDDQALAVVAHELAHARHRDVVVGTTLAATGASVGVGLLALVLGARSRRGRPGAGEVAAVPAVLALVAVATLLVSPAQSGVSRAIETRADLDALHATEDPAAVESVQRRLAERSLADPTPPALTQWWFGSHPTVLQRVSLARAYADDPARFG